MALLTASCTPADALNMLASRSGFEISYSIRYGDGARQTLDVYRPHDVTDAPVIVFFYGGSWQGGSKESYLFVAAALAHRGYTVVVPDYRVYPEVRFPIFLEDGARAVRWVKQNAPRFGGDPNKLFVMGHSAGAYIAAMLGIDQQWLASVDLDPRRDIAGLIGISGPYDFLPLKDETLKTIFGGDNRPTTQPINYVTGGEPPALLVTAQSDNTVNPGNTNRLAERLRAAGGGPSVILYSLVGHLSIMATFAAPLRFLAPVLVDVAAFIDRVTPPSTRYAVGPVSDRLTALR